MCNKKFSGWDSSLIGGPFQLGARGILPTCLITPLAVKQSRLSVGVETLSFYLATIYD